MFYKYWLSHVPSAPYRVAVYTGIYQCEVVSYHIYTIGYYHALDFKMYSVFSTKAKVKSEIICVSSP